jgi:large-conductance mechanosensitive channel
MVIPSGAVVVGGLMVVVGALVVVVGAAACALVRSLTTTVATAPVRMTPIAKPTSAVSQVCWYQRGGRGGLLACGGVRSSAI